MLPRTRPCEMLQQSGTTKTSGRRTRRLACDGIDCRDRREPGARSFLQDEDPLRVQDVRFDVALYLTVSARAPEASVNKTKGLTCSMRLTHMLSTSSISSVGSWNEILAATRSICSDSVGGPVGGSGEPFVSTKSLHETGTSVRQFPRRKRAFASSTGTYVLLAKFRQQTVSSFSRKSR